METIYTLYTLLFGNNPDVIYTVADLGLSALIASIALGSAGIGAGLDSAAKARKAQRGQQREQRKMNAINAMFAPYTGVQSKALDMRPASGSLEGAFKGAAQGLNLYNQMQNMESQKKLQDALTENLTKTGTKTSGSTDMGGQSMGAQNMGDLPLTKKQMIEMGINPLKDPGFLNLGKF